MLSLKLLFDTFAARYPTSIVNVRFEPNTSRVVIRVTTNEHVHELRVDPMSFDPKGEQLMAVLNEMKRKHEEAKLADLIEEAISDV